MEELVKSHEFAVLDFRSAFADGGQFGSGGLDGGVTGFEVLAPSFPQQFGAGAVLFLLDPLHLFGHRRRQGNGHGIGGSHTI